VTPHSEDVQLVQDHPQASKVRRVTWKFPDSQTDKQAQASNKYNITFGSNESYKEPTNRREILTSSSENDLLEKEQSQASYEYNITFGSNDSLEEPTNTSEILTSSSNNDLLEKEPSQVSAAAVTPHSEDVQLVQDHPQASKVRRVTWKFPISQNEEIPSNASAANEHYGSEKLQDSYQQNKDKINSLYHRMDIVRTKLLKKNFFLTREKDRRVAAENSCSISEEKLKDLENCLTCERHLRQKCEQELKECSEVIAEFCETLKSPVSETEYQSVVKEVESLKEQLKEKTASNIDLASKLKAQEEATKTQEKKVAELMKAVFLSVIIKPEDKTELYILPKLHLDQIRLPPKNIIVEELASQVEVSNLEVDGVPGTSRHGGIFITDPYPGTREDFRTRGRKRNRKGF